MKTCRCGCGVPVGEGKTYASNACKQKVYRARNKTKARSMAQMAADLIWHQFDENTASQISALLEDVKTPKAINSVGAAIYLMLTEKNSGRHEHA